MLITQNNKKYFQSRKIGSRFINSKTNTDKNKVSNFLEIIFMCILKLNLLHNHQYQ